MADSRDTPAVGEVGALCAQLRDVSDRLARFEDVPQHEIDDLMERKVTVLGPSTFVLDHGSVGYQSMRSGFDDRLIGVVIEDDEVEVTLVTSPAKMLAIGLNIAGMAASEVER